jgi:nicotinamidase-related amidase
VLNLEALEDIDTLTGLLIPAVLAASDRAQQVPRTYSRNREQSKEKAMATTTIDKRPALVMIDLQNGILALPTLLSQDDIKNRARQLAAAFRANSLPVVRVKVAWSADGGDLPPGRALIRGEQTVPPTAYSEFPEDFPPHPGDIVVIKRHWGAFTGTELDLQLRRRGVTQIVLAGISTSIGVESTARSAWENSYNLIFVEDAITDVDSSSHAHTFTKIFPRLGEIATTEQIIDTLKGRSMDPAVGGSISRVS